MLATERGRMWLARWHSTTPSMSDEPRSSGSTTFNLLSMLCGGNDEWRLLETSSEVNVLVAKRPPQTLPWPETAARGRQRTSRSCSMSSSSSLSCSIFLRMVNWGSTDSRLLWLLRNTARHPTGRPARESTQRISVCFRFRKWGRESRSQSRKVQSCHFFSYLAASVGWSDSIQSDQIHSDLIGPHQVLFPSIYVPCTTVSTVTSRCHQSSKQPGSWSVASLYGHLNFCRSESESIWVQNQSGSRSSPVHTLQSDWSSYIESLMKMSWSEQNEFMSASQIIRLASYQHRHCIVIKGLSAKQNQRRKYRIAKTHRK